MLRCDLQVPIPPIARFLVDKQDMEPDKKRGKRASERDETNEDSDSEDENYGGSLKPSAAAHDSNVLEDVDEEEWNEQDLGGGGNGEGEEGREPKAKKLKRRGGGGDDFSSKKPKSDRKRAPRWTKEVFFLLVHLYVLGVSLVLRGASRTSFQSLLH